MLIPLAGLPAGVIGFEADGEIHESDYRDILMPAVRAVWERGEDVRIVLVFPRWGGMSPGAGWQDLKMGFEHLRRWKRIALVTDLDWMITVTSLFGWMTPGELKRFPLADRDAAIAWAAGDGGDEPPKALEP
ncbi:MAG TPA: STAS/SEC14 domain-containing protein [Actinomycetota bacterium]|nr:STAS/SEC14 domain-containing protein [Actinomycetota bacterium]